MKKHHARIRELPLGPQAFRLEIETTNDGARLEAEAQARLEALDAQALAQETMPWTTPPPHDAGRLVREWDPDNDKPTPLP